MVRLDKEWEKHKSSKENLNEEKKNSLQLISPELWKEFEEEIEKVKDFDISKIQLSPENNKSLDIFFKKFLDPKEIFPEGSRHSIIEKNFAIYIVKNKIDIEEIKNAYESNKFNFNSLLSQIKGVTSGSYGEDPNVNIGELVNWCKQFRPDLIKDLIVSENEFTYEEKVEGKDGKTKIKIRVSIDKLADHLINKFNFKTIFGTKSEKVFFYENGMYHFKGKSKIKTEVEKILKTKSRTYIVNEILEKIKRKTEIPENYFNEFSIKNLNLINLKNGVYSIKKKKLLEHSKEYFFLFKIPVKYNPNAKCPLFDKFLNEILYPEDVIVMYEWFGYNLYRKYFIKKGLILDGEKDTGKTTLLDILIGFLGEENKTGIPLQKITGGSDFTKLSLRNKHGNIYDDLSSKDLSDGGGFKIATGGGHISAEEKFGDYIQFITFAKQSHATNKIPPNQDKGDKAYYSRWLPIKLDNPPKKIDHFLKEKIICEEEMSGILNIALNKLDFLLKKGKFSFDKTDQEIEDIMERSGNPLLVFVMDCLKPQEKATITKEEMYLAYSKWSKTTENPRLSKEQLGRRLEINCNFIIAKRGTGKIGRYWEGAKLKENFDSFDTLKKTITTKKNIKKSIQNNDIFLKQYNKMKSVESDTKNIDIEVVKIK